MCPFIEWHRIRKSEWHSWVGYRMGLSGVCRVKYSQYTLMHPYTLSTCPHLISQLTCCHLSWCRYICTSWPAAFIYPRHPYNMKLYSLPAHYFPAPISAGPVHTKLSLLALYPSYNGFLFLNHCSRCIGGRIVMWLHGGLNLLLISLPNTEIKHALHTLCTVRWWWIRLWSDQQDFTKTCKQKWCRAHQAKYGNIWNVIEKSHFFSIHSI